MEPRHLCDIIDRFLPELERAYKVLPYFEAEVQNERDIIDRFLPELERAYKVLPYFEAEVQNERDIAGWLACGILECVADAEALKNINRSLSRVAEKNEQRLYQDGMEPIEEERQ